MEKRTVLLTGGAGYIGSHTAVLFLEAGYDVVVADNYSNSSPESIKRVEELTGKKVALYEADVCDKAKLETIFSNHKIDAVVHFAGLKAVGESVAIPDKYYDVNINSTLAVVDVMRKYGCNTLVFSSSATVYGVPKTVPLVEGMPTSCTNPYGWTKLMNEQILTDIANADENMSVVLLRYFNPIGAHKSGRIGENPNGIPNNLLPYITQVAIGKLQQLSIFGSDYPTHDGTGVRDYIHVVDLANGHLKAVDYALKNKGVDVFNLGTGNGYSVLDIVKAFSKINGVEVNYKIVDRRPGDVAACYADASKAKTVLGWEATLGLEDMCRDSWNWQKNNPNGYSI